MVVVKFVGICQDEFEPCPVMENPEFYLVAVMGVSLIFLAGAGGVVVWTFFFFFSFHGTPLPLT